MDLRNFPHWVRQRIELSTLVGALLVAAGVWAFVALAGEVLEGDTKGLDTAILLFLRNPADLTDPIGPPWVEEIGRDMTALGGTGTLILLTVFVIGLLWMQGNRRSMLLVAAAVGSGQLLDRFLKMGFDRPRPDLVPHGSYVYTASFPSGHAMMSTIVYLTLAILVARVQHRRRVRAYLIVCACLLAAMIGVSRVYLGVHWPSDVLAGWTVGAAWAVVWWLIARWLGQRGAVEPEAASDHMPALSSADSPSVEQPASTDRQAPLRR